MHISNEKLVFIGQEMRKDIKGGLAFSLFLFFSKKKKKKKKIIETCEAVTRT